LGRFESFPTRRSSDLAGRFVGSRSFPETPCRPCWSDIAPRFGLAYDLTGDAKTALKAGVNKYNTQLTTGFADRYNPMNLSTDTRSEEHTSELQSRGHL